MEVKKEFKQTEVGRIPLDWEVNELKEYCTKLNVGFVGVCEPFYTNENNGVLLIRTGNLHGDKLDLSEVKYVTAEFHKANRKSQIRAGDILIARHGYSGNAVLVPNNLDEANTLNIVVLRTNNNLLLNKYAGYAINSDLVRKQATNKTVGSTQGVINTREIAILRIAVPSLPEQRIIAGALGGVDALLTAIDELIAKKRLIKQGAIQELLTVKKRLPGFNCEWEVKTLGELGEITGAGVDKKIIFDELPVRLVNYLDVYRRDFIYSNDLNQWVTASPAQVKRCAVVKGDIFFTPSSEMPYDIGISAIAVEDIPDAAYSYHVVRLRLYERIDWDLAFRAYIFKTKYFLDQADTVCEGSGQRYVITLQNFRELRVYYPVDKAEQTAIAEILSDMDAEIMALEARREKTRLLKQGMMQELLTGRIRLI